MFDLKLLTNLLDPAVLFFFFGVFAASVRSNLEIPQSIAKFFSLYLLMALGLKGGAELAKHGLPHEALVVLGLALLMAALVPSYSFLILRRRLGAYDAAATAATYGSVSAVTFIAAGEFLQRQGVEFGGHMTVALVLMESPAIIMGVLLANWVRSHDTNHAQGGQDMSLGKALREAFTDGAHLLLLGSMLVGFLAGEAGAQAMKPFTGDVFKGILAFFLLEMGLLVARRMREAKVLQPALIAFSILMPPVNAMVAMGLARLAGVGVGDAMLLSVLAASASYIAVPAVVRYAIPEAKASIYFTMSLAMTFPFNITIGIPLYYEMTQLIWR